MTCNSDVLTIASKGLEPSQVSHSLTGLLVGCVRRLNAVRPGYLIISRPSGTHICFHRTPPRQPFTNTVTDRPRWSRPRVRPLSTFQKPSPSLLPMLRNRPNRIGPVRGEQLRHTLCFLRNARMRVISYSSVTCLSHSLKVCCCLMDLAHRPLTWRYEGKPVRMPSSATPSTNSRLGSSQSTGSTASNSFTSPPHSGPPMTSNDVPFVFRNINDITSLSSQLVNQLETAFEHSSNNGDEDNVGEIFLEIVRY